MFYIKEFVFRLLYFLIHFISIFFLCGYNNNILLTSLVSPITKEFYYNSIIFDIAFIFNSHAELINVNLLISLLISLSFSFPYLIWQFFLFFCSSLSKEKFHIYKSMYLITLNYYFVFLLLSIFYLIPLLWTFCDLILFLFFISLHINIDFEPSIFNYLIFIYQVFIYATVLSIYFFILNNIFVIFRLKTLLRYKKLIKDLFITTNLIFFIFFIIYYINHYILYTLSIFFTFFFYKVILFAKMYKLIKTYTIKKCSLNF